MKTKTWLHNAEDIPCPTCQIGKLEWLGKGNVVINETLGSLKDNEFHRNGMVFPYTTELVSSHLKCSRCNDVVVGVYKRIDDVRNVDENGDEQSYNEPLFFNPPPRIIDIPLSCPKEVKDPIERSFTLYWVDLNSCANKIRIALESLMDHCGIPGTNAKGKFITLDTRLKEYSKSNKKIGQFLDALRLIGNASSHNTGITKDTVIAAYELLEYVLELTFPDKDQRLIDLSNTIITNKGHVK